MALTHNSTTADNEPSWGDIDKTKLPRNAFADMGDPEKKSTWRYPHHWVKNGEMGEDESGNEVYVNGDMYLHEGGLDAAWGAAQGARSGEKASQEIRDHLQQHRQALDKADEDSSSQHTLYNNMHGPWAITRDGMNDVLAMVDKSTDVSAVMSKQGERPRDTSLTTIRDGVAIIEIVGPIFHYQNILTEIFGLPAVETISSEYRAALENPEIKSIILWIDSPGGQMGGINELSGQIKEGKQKKRTVAYVGDLGASAAYWLASAASEIITDAAAELGSIGVVLGLRRQNNRSIEIINSESPRKRPDPESDEGKRQLQERADALAKVFIEAIAENRSLARKQVTSLQGDIAIASEAIELGLADRQGSLEKLIQELQNNNGGNNMEINAQNIKDQYPKVAEELQKEGEQNANQETQQNIVGIVGAVFGEEASKKVQATIDAGMTAEQIKQAKTLFGQPQGSQEGDAGQQEPTRQDILTGIQDAHGQNGVSNQGDNDKQPSLAQEAEQRAKGKTE